MEGASNTLSVDNEFKLLPLKIDSYGGLYINIILNLLGVNIFIPQEQEEMSIGDRYEIYYAPVRSNNSMGEPVLITKNVVTEVHGEPYTPAFLTSSGFFPVKEKLSITLWYVVIKKHGHRLKSEPILQCLATA